MNKKELAKIPSKKLQEWTDQGLLTYEQALKIADYEKSKNKFSWILFGVLSLGVIVVCIGIISIVAANWDEIPANIKLALDFAFLAAIATGIFRAHQSERYIVLESLLIVFILTCLASLGLIGQIYNLTGSLHGMLLFWALSTASAAFISQRSFVPFLWTSLFLGSSVFWLISSNLLNFLFGKAYPIGFIATMPLLCALMVLSLKLVKDSDPFVKAFRFWMISLGLFAIGNADFIISIIPQDWDLFRFFNANLYLAYLFALVLVFVVAQQKDISKGTKAVVLAALLVYFAMFQEPVLMSKFKLLGPFLTIPLLAMLAVIFANFRLRFYFHVVLVALGLRFLVLYFQAFGGLAMTGFGLVLSGAVIIFLVYAYSNYSKRLQSMAENLIND